MEPLVPTQAIVQSVLFILSILLGRWLFRYIVFQMKVRKLPGPRSSFLLGSTLDIVTLDRADVYHQLEKWWQEHSSNGLYCIRFPHVTYIIPTSPDYVEKILSSPQHIEKSNVYRYFHPWLGINLLTSGGSYWKTRRKMLTPTFHFKILEDFIEVFNKHSETLVRKLESRAGGQTFDLYPFITLCALDIICETAMGTNKVNAQENEYSEYVTALYEISTIIYKRMLNPILGNDFVFWLSTDGRKQSRCLKILHSFTDKVIAERKAEMKNGDVVSSNGKKKRQAFLDLLLEISQNGGQLSDTDLRAEVDTFMFEGHDTTSSGLSWTCYLLGLHPGIQEKVYEEQYSIFGNENRSITVDDLKAMKYLECVIKESLRIYSPVPSVSRQLYEDFQLGNYTIPRGCSVSLFSALIHKDPNSFPEPEKFDPDRFLPENSVGRHPFAYIPFSAGPRNCIGQKFALMEEKVILSHVLRSYRIESIDKPEDLKLLAEIILRPKDGFNMKFYKRT